MLNGVSIAKELKKIYLADNQFNEDEDVLESIKSCMNRNKTLARYDFRNNDLKDDGKLIRLQIVLTLFYDFSRYLFHRYAWPRGGRQNLPCYGD